jgi:ABC-2 type transport system ATP-binding protein
MLLRTEALTKNYGRFRALEGVDLAIRPAEVFGILGPNGSGKTTALRLILGFLRPTSGHAWVAGHECWSDGVAARRHVAYLPGELRLYENLTGRQLVQFLCRLRGQEVRAEVDDLARDFEIDLSQPLASLSSGMKRKVALLTVLAPHVAIVIMDEPTNALDPTMRDLLLAQVRHARDRGQAVVFSSHVLTEVEEVCDRVAILRRGRLVHLQEMAQLRAGRRVQLRLLEGKALGPLVAGLQVVAEQDGAMMLEYSGPLGALLAWLAEQPVADVRLEPLGLRAIYQRYHGSLNGENSG